jgi:hypothetical protein
MTPSNQQKTNTDYDLIIIGGGHLRGASLLWGKL